MVQEASDQLELRCHRWSADHDTSPIGEIAGGAARELSEGNRDGER